MNLSTPQYVLPDHVCPFAVRVPHGLSLADFLGSMITHTIGFFRRRLHTLKFSSDVDLPAILNAYTLQRGLPSPRGGFTAPSPRRPMRQ